jgi:hypothetical protein
LQNPVENADFNLPPGKEKAMKYHSGQLKEAAQLWKNPVRCLNAYG